MRRISTHTLFSLIGCCLFVACSMQDDPAQGRLATLSNGADLPEECHGCWEQFKDCVEHGDDLVACEEAIIECADTCGAPPPPQECDHCAAGYDGCTGVANGEEEVFDCVIGIEACLRACVRDEPVEPPEPGNCAVCDMQFEECINEEWQETPDHPGQLDEVEHCEEVLANCRAECEPWPDPTPVDACHTCQLRLQECHENGHEDPGAEPTEPCEEIISECEHLCRPTDPPNGTSDEICQHLRDRCEDLGVDDCLGYGDELCSELNVECSNDLVEMCLT